MKKFFLFSLISMLAIALCACSDNEDEPNSLLGTWQYEQPHFEFEYAQDSIVISMGQYRKMSIAVKDLKTMFLSMAKEKMGDYFKGVTFSDDNTLKVNMSLQNGTPATLGATYKVDERYIEVALNSADLAQLTGGIAPDIPKISFIYQQKGDELLMYFDKTYLKNMIAMMQDQLLSILLPSIIEGFDQFPDTMKQIISGSVKEQIATIFDNTLKLELGFTLSNHN
ncbi:hypothetical protein [Odoribacter laneus]|uniref:hypothetical protein n=1 Tax=Odoribacter laneus TaxID=626933 RepID=UPI00033CD1E5|nr:hypothetical protein [Odoribacter laneus]CCZ81683.1 putative uncharacterized protein [Odoribacter laneus CAG:561]